MNIHKAFAITLMGMAISSNSFGQSSFDGSVELQHRQFFDESTIQASNTQTSIALSLDYLTEWNQGNDRLEIETFLRVDNQDSERSHFDLRQFLWTKFGNNWEVSVGLGRVFWGVTETQHLVDIINQTDLVENIDGEDKLGQPMFKYQYFADWGALETYLLPRFRERTFEGRDGRLNGGIIVSDDPDYESSAEENNLDYALRYSNTFGLIDLGISWFSGTSREPELLLGLNPTTSTTAPFYPQINQLATDIQLTVDGWLFKFEAIDRDYESETIEDFRALTAGFEYTLVGILGTPYDLGLLGEYSWDERGLRATSPFQDDITLGARLSLNDLSDSQFLLGVSEDNDFSDSKSLFLEGNTRLSNRLSLNVEMRIFDAKDQRDPLYFFKDSSFLQIGLEYFFD